MLVLGDAHASDSENRRALLSAYDAADADVALQVGDLQYYHLPTPTWFIAGNNEDLDTIEALRNGNDVDGKDVDGVANAHLLDSSAVEREGIRIAGLSGNFAPTQFEKPRADLEGDRRRHFVEEDVERAAELEDIDVFLAHEAPHGVLGTNGYDVGCKHVDRILTAVEPDLCLVGHHHEHVESNFGGTRVIGLAPVWESYYTLDVETHALERFSAPE